MGMSVAMIQFPNSLRSCRFLSSKSWLRDDARNLVFIHIGKCGGASVWDAVKKSPVVEAKFSRVQKVHIAKPPVLRRAKYLVVVRDPISRAVSAFNWRYKLVVAEEAQRHRFPGEWEALTKYHSINNLAEALFVNDRIDPAAAQDFLLIHHMKEGFQYYLGDLLESIDSGQIFAVIATETLKADLQRFLSVGAVEKFHDNSSDQRKGGVFLSDSARRNLRRFLSGEYDCYEKLIILFATINHRGMKEKGNFVR